MQNLYSGEWIRVINLIAPAYISLHLSLPIDSTEKNTLTMIYIVSSSIIVDFHIIIIIVQTTNSTTRIVMEQWSQRNVLLLRFIVLEWIELS